MHRIATKPGELDLERKLEKGANAVQQTPADILFVSTADTELSGLAQVWGKRFRKKARLTLRLMQANPLQHPAAAEHYADNVLCKAKLAIFRLHGGYGYMWEYPVARMFADSRVQRIYGGTNEIMKTIIAKANLRLNMLSINTIF